jgi:hypothetical protein
MALILTVTPAGRAALRNAQGDGTNAVRIATVGVTATAIATGAPVADEIKRIATIAGGATSADTIHVTVTDAGTDVYTVRGFGFYLTDGTLFASYGQAAVIVEKSAQSMMQLAVDVQFADIAASEITFGNTDFNNPAATTEMLGVVELATDTETTTGTDPQRVVTPKGLLAAFNARFGAGAPSAFVKTMLDKVSALAFVTALGIRGAASYDVGAGNGLDADLLDGQHGAYYLDYSKLTGVPATFTPAPHQHSAADITSGVLGVLRGGTGVATFAAGSYLVGNGTGAIVVKTPAQVLADIGAAAAVHSHEISAVNGLQAALDVRPVQTAVTAQISAAVNALIDGAPGAIDTLNELAAAMGDDPNFAATVTNALATKAGITANNNFTGANRFTGDSALSVDGPTSSRLTLYTAGVRRGLLSVSGATGIGSFVVYAADGGTAIGQLDIGTGGMKYGGSFTLNCLASTDTFIVNTPGSSPAGSYVSITSPGSLPGIIGQYGTTKRRDIIFSNSGLQFAVSAGTGTASPQYTFGETGQLSLAALAASGAITGASVRATGTIMAAGGFQIG